MFLSQMHLIAVANISFQCVSSSATISNLRKLLKLTKHFLQSYSDRNYIRKQKLVTIFIVNSGLEILFYFLLNDINLELDL